MGKLKHDRPTIGILAGWSDLEGTIPDHYRASVLRGIQSAALTRECHLLLGWGLGRGSGATNIYPAWPTASPSSDFVPVGPWNTDGLIVFTPLRNESRSHYLQQLMAEGYPVLFIATGEPGPCVAVNNREGIYQAATHLVSHGHHSIAYIAGDENDRGDSEERLRAYHSAVAELGLDADPRLIATGWHNIPGGQKAMEELLASGAKFTAVLASNDNSAIGAMRAIRAAGLQVPRDLAIIGFDDQPEVTAQVPPMASVHVPLKNVGEQALLSMVDHLTHGTALESVPIPTRLMRRRSCGCLPDAVISSADSSSHLRIIPHAGSETRAARALRIKQLVVDEMVAVLPAEGRLPDEDRTRRLCTSLVDGFYLSLKEARLLEFQTVLMEILQEMELVDGNMDPWQEIISVLRREVVRLLTKTELARTGRLAEDMLHQARAAISESAQRQDRRHEHEQEEMAHQISVLSARLSATLDERQAVDLLNSHVNRVGIRHVRVARFEAEGDDPFAWSKLFSFTPEGTDQRFRSREFPPAGLYPPEELLNLVLLPLVFKDELLGYVAFDAANIEPCKALARQLASAFKSAQLHAQVVELSLTDPLTGLHNRRYFDMFLKSEVDRSRRFGRGLAVIMIDIDHFKTYNDAFGHLEGDDALRTVAHCLQMGRRSVDVVARLGGEEFGVILPETDTNGTFQVAERIRASVAGLTNLRRPLTISLGVTSMSTLGGLFAEAMMQQADSALYEAKRKGRNQVCVFEQKPIQAGDAGD